MRLSKLARSLATALLIACACGSDRPDRRPSAPTVYQTLRPGRQRAAYLFRRACAPCHGTAGDGVGASEPGIKPPPRNLAVGTYRFRSTPTGSLPTDADIERTIRRGLPGTWMPPWEDVLCPDEIAELVAHVKGLSPDFADEQPDPPIPIPKPPPATPEAIERGRAAYLELGCPECHGERGDGNGRVEPEDLRDDRGHPVRATSFVDGPLKIGRDPRDVYRAIVTGLDGSPMPAYAQVASPARIYDIVHFLLSRSPRPAPPSYRIAATEFLAPCRARISGGR